MFAMLAAAAMPLSMLLPYDDIACRYTTNIRHAATPPLLCFA